MNNTAKELYPHLAINVQMRDPNNKMRPTLVVYAANTEGATTAGEAIENAKMVLSINFDINGEGDSDITFYAPDGSVLVQMKNDDETVDDTIINAKLNAAWDTEGSNYAQQIQSIVINVIANIATVEMAASMADEAGGEIDAQALFNEVQSRQPGKLYSDLNAPFLSE